jgi:hypothetical protein
MLTRLLFLMISIALATSVFADLALGPNPPLPPSIQMSKQENNPMQDIIAGILMTCAMMTSGYLIIRRKGFTFSRCIGAIIFLLTIFMAVLGFVFDKEYRREYQRYQNSLLKLRSLTPDEATVDNDR